MWSDEKEIWGEGMKAYVLAGGEGTRMQPWTNIIPKCLLPVNGIPVSRIIVERLIDEGISEVILCINKIFEREFRHEFRDCGDIKFSITDNPQGTAGEVHYGLQNYPPRDEEETFCVIYADDLTEIDYSSLLVQHYEDENDITIAVTSNVPLDVGIVEIEDKDVTEFKEKPQISNLKTNSYVWTGVAYFKSALIPFFSPGRDIAKDIFTEVLEKKLKIGVFISNKPWWDIGQLSHYKTVKEEFER